MSKRILSRYRLIVLVLCLTNFTSLKSYGQEYSFINYNVKDGLPSSTVYDIVQDKDGFIWFATENGLSRFDGKRFTNITINEGLPDNEILKLFVDSKNRIWIMPFKAELCYWYKGKLYTRHNDPLLGKLNLKANVFSLHEDKQGNLAICEHTILHVIRTNNTVETVTEYNGRPLCGHIAGTDTAGNIKLVIGICATAYDPTRYFYYYPVSKKAEPFPDEFYGDNRLAIVNPAYLVYQESKTKVIINHDGKRDSVIVPNNAIQVSDYNNGNFSFNTEAGAILYNITTRQSIKPLPPNIGVLSSILDKEKNYWFGSRGKGVFMIPSLAFKNIILNPDHPAMWSLLRIKDMLYVGGERYVWKGKLTDLNFTPDSLMIPGVIDPTRVTTLTNYKNNLIVGTSLGKAANRALNMNYTTGSIKHASLKNDRILYSTHMECGFYDIITRQKEVIWKNRTTCAVETDSGYYIGTLNGLYFKSYSGDTLFFGKTYPFLSNRVAAIAVSPEGVVMVGVKGAGLAGLKNQKLSFHLTEENGLSNNSPTTITIDSNIIWVGTERGLNRIISSDKGYKITKFSSTDGLPTDRINAITTNGDTILVASSAGLTYFMPDKISQQSGCDLRMTGVYVSGHYWAYDSTNFTLPHADNDLRFDYSGISFKSGGDINFQYRLLGLHSDWRSTSENNLSFPALPSGNYTLEVKAINKYGVESPVRQVSFTIRKLFWEETWFRLASIAVLAAAIWLFIRYRINRIRLKEREKNRINRHITELEQSALRSQMNPHFIFNSLNSIQQYVVERDISGANKFITDFSHLIRMTLDYSSKSTIRLTDEIRYIDTYLRLEKTRLEEKFNYSISVDRGINPDDYTIPSLLLQPFVENSIRHGIKYRDDSKGLIQIHIGKTEKGLLITIEDNGIGRKTSGQYKSEHHVQYQSKGMLLSSGRIDLLNSHGDEKIDLNIIDMYDNESRATGTRIELLLANYKINDN